MTDPKQDVRQQFEAWVKDERGYTELGVSNLRLDNGYCFDSDLYLFWLAYQAALQSPAVREMAEALRTIEAWELPETGETWPSGNPISYEAQYGSDGARDYIRGIARAALRTLGAGHVE